MAQNGISTATSTTPVLTKLLRRDLKLAEAQAKRQSSTSTWYRPLNQLNGTHQAYVNGAGGPTLETLSGSASPTPGHPWSTGTVAPPWTLPAGMSLHEPLEGSGGSNPTVPGTTYLTAAASGINAAFGTRGTPYDPSGNVTTVSNSAAGLYREKYVGRPWSTYNAFSEFDLTWFSDPTHGPIGVDVYGYAGFGMRTDLGALPTLEDGYALMWRGYVQAPATGTFNFWTAGTDDDAAIWVGTDALTPTYANMNGRASGDRVLSLNSVNLTAGQWYPVRMVFVEFGGAEQCQWFLQDSTNGVLYNGTDLTWAYNTSTNGY